MSSGPRGLPGTPGPSDALRRVVGLLPTLLTVGFACSLIAAAAGGRQALAFLWFLAVCWVCLYLPGRQLLDVLGAAVGPLETAARATLLGALTAAAWFWLVGLLDVRGLFWLLPASGLVAHLRRGRRRDARQRPEMRWSHVALAATTMLAIVPLYIVPIYFTNLVSLAGGGLTFQKVPDVVFHAGLARELQHAIPPTAPFLPGVPLSYHFGMDLVVSLLAFASGLDVSDVLVRFTPTLFVATTTTAAFCFARAWLGSESGASWFTFLVFFGEDLSYLLGWITGSSNAWVIEFFGIPSLVSLYLLNPTLPALSLLFAGLSCLLRYCQDPAGSRASGTTSVLLLAGLAGFKVFAGVQLAASLGIAAGLLLLRRRDGRLVWPFLGASAVALLTVVPALAAGSAQLDLKLAHWPWATRAVSALGLSDVEGLPYWGAALPLFVVGVLGARCLGLAAWLRELASMTASRGGQLAAAVFVGLGPLLTLSSTITPSGYDSSSLYNESVWFFAQSKYVAWIFAVSAVRLSIAGLPTLMRAGVVCAVSLCAVPSSVQYMLFQARYARPSVFEADEVAALRGLEEVSSPGDVVLAEGDLALGVVSLTHCRAPELRVFAFLHLPPEELERWSRDRQEFWDDWRRGRFRHDIAARRGARFVLAQRAPAGLRPIATYGRLGLYRVP